MLTRFPAYGWQSYDARYNNWPFCQCQRVPLPASPPSATGTQGNGDATRDRNADRWSAPWPGIPTASQFHEQHLEFIRPEILEYTPHRPLPQDPSEAGASPPPFDATVRLPHSVDKRAVRLSSLVHPGPKLISCPDPSAEDKNLANILACFFIFDFPDSIT